MTQEALKIRDYILNSALSDSAKNEILPLLGAIDTPGIKERILKILEIEGKAATLEEKFIDMDISGTQSPANPVTPVAPAPQAPVMPVVAPVQTPNPFPANLPNAPIPPVPVPPTNTVNTPPVPQSGTDEQTLRQLEDQLKQLQQK